MIVPAYTECTQTEFSQPIVSETATCDYCITQEEYERLTADPYAETTSCSSVYPKECGYDYDYEAISDDIEDKEHCCFLSKFHAIAAQLRTGFKRVIYWKRTRSRLFKVHQRLDEAITLVMVIIIFPLV